MKAMRDELAELISQFPISIKPRPLKNPENRGLARSAFQKEIRRGRVDAAISMGEFLLDADPTYAWRSLATVMIEDIGYANVDLVTYSTLTTLKSVRTSVPEVQLFGAMVAAACAGPKSQACCQLSLGTDKSHADEWAHMASQTFDHLLIEAESLDMIRAYMALVQLRKLCRNQPVSTMVPILKNMMNNFHLTDNQTRACMCSFERPVDDMNLALYPLLHSNTLQVHTKDYIVVDETDMYPPEEMIMSISSCAFDMHTYYGGRALRKFYNYLRKKYEWVNDISYDDSSKALGSLVFMVEGGLVNTRMMYASHYGLQQYQQVYFAESYGAMGSGDGWKGVPLVDRKVDVEDNIDVLNTFRKEAVSG